MRATESISRSPGPQRRRAVGLEPRPAQVGLDARHQLARGERLGDVVVGAQLQAEDLVELLAARRQHDDRDVALGADALADLEPVEPGQHQVEHHQVDRLAVDHLEGVVAARGGDHREPGVAQRVLDDGADGLLVLDDEDAVGQRRTSRSLRRMVAARPATARRLPGALTTGRYPARMPRLGPPRETPYPGAPPPPAAPPAPLAHGVADPRRHRRGRRPGRGAPSPGTSAGSETVIARDPTPLPVSLPAAAAARAEQPRDATAAGAAARRAGRGRRELARRGEGDGGQRRGRAARIGLPRRFPRAHPHQRPRAGDRRRAPP